MAGPRFHSPVADAAPILVGFSGGLDSSVLLHWLAGQPRVRAAGLRAAHVHHGLHAEANGWAAHCQRACDRLGVAIEIVAVAVRNDLGLGPEAAARAARHAAFDALLRPGETLALAHHRDDQAETILLRLLRGAGSDGLAAMRVVRSFGAGKLWRPFLDTPRSALLEYAESNSLVWIEDPSNRDTRPDRNFLRHDVLPRLNKRWPHASAALAGSARWLDEDANLLKGEALRRLEQVQGPEPNCLRVKALLALEPPWRARVLRAWRSTLGYSPWPQSAHAVIESQLLDARPDALPEYRWPGGVLRRWRDLLYLDRERPPLPADWSCEWDGQAPLALPTGDSLVLLPGKGVRVNFASRNFTLTPFPVLVRARQGGERIQLPGRTHTHSLKHVLQELGVPPWLRARLPLLFAADGELLAAGDSIVSARLDEYFRVKGVRVKFREAKFTQTPFTE